MYKNKHLSSSDIIFIKVFYYFFKICGLMTVNIKMKFSEIDKFKYLSFKFSIKGLVYNIFLISCVSGLNFLSIIYLNNFVYMVTFENSFQKIQTTLTFITSFSILILYCCQQKKFIKIAKNLQLITDSLIYIHSEKSERFIVLQSIKLIYLANSLIWIIILISAYLMFDPLFYCSFVILTNLTINWMIMQYTSIILFTYQVFKIFNSKLKYTFENNILDDSEINSIKLKKYLFFHLHRWYLSLCGITKEISDFYSPAMLLCIIYIFITSILYLFYNGDLMLYGKLPDITIFDYLNCLLWVILYFFSLMVISKAASRTEAEVR